MAEINDYEKKHLQIVDDYISECVVLLRKNGDFPLNGDEKKIYLYGNGVRKTIKGGTGSSDVTTRYFENIEEAFTKANFEILTKDYLNAYDKVFDKAKNEFRKDLRRGSLLHPISNIIKSMGTVMNEPEYNIPFEKEGDVAIYVLSRISGEGNDRKFVKGDALLTDTERSTILTLAKGFKKFMLVLNTGGPIDLSGLDEVKNILLLSQLGILTSKALVDVVTGKKYPSGKLTTTWTKQGDYPTIGDFGHESDTNYTEGIYVGYRYFDTMDVNVLFPFGFGLGYTDFQYEVASVHLNGEVLDVDVTLKNIGRFKGKEVIQIYLSKPATTLDEPYQVLVNFQKSKELEPEQTETVRLSFKFSDAASYDSKSESYILDEGVYRVRVGTSSRQTQLCAFITNESRITVRKVQNKMGECGFEDFHPECKKALEEAEDIPKFTLDAQCIKEEVVHYESAIPSSEINEEVKTLSKEEKARLVIGAFKMNGGVMSIIGNQAVAVAGAAGETAQVSDLKPVVMADGPVGLRLATDYYDDKDGVGCHSVEGAIPSYVEDSLPGVIRFAVKLITPKVDKNVVIKHQYTTAIPIGTAIAQSWNLEFAEKCGDLVGNEMERFKVHLWLAPALNIHRNVLCGRNFEYFSEDPYVSGVMATALTKGVQKHKHTYVTLKHYAANNQETNRYNNSSNVSERALREIYLKGFEMCVKEGQPRAVMTSYNLINGVHTSESRPLNYDLLRQEFGFRGIIMTDWVVSMGMSDKNSKYKKPLPSKMVQATGDLFMPGSKEDYEEVMKALRNGTLCMEDLELSATRVYNLAKEIES